MSENNILPSEKEVIAGALAAGGIGANLIIGCALEEADESTLCLKDIDDFINYEVAI